MVALLLQPEVDIMIASFSVIKLLLCCHTSARKSKHPFHLMPLAPVVFMVVQFRSLPLFTLLGSRVKQDRDGNDSLSHYFRTRHSLSIKAKADRMRVRRSVIVLELERGNVSL